MYLIWSIINSIFIIVFVALILTLIFKGKEVFNNRYGNLIIIIIVLGVLGILNNNNDNPKNEYVFFDNKELVGRTVEKSRILIEDNVTFDIYLTIRFRKNTSGELVQGFSRSKTTGFTSGFVWNYKYTDVDKLDANTYVYTTVGTLDWHLFGIRIYSQDKEFTGTFSLDQETLKNYSSQ